MKYFAKDIIVGNLCRMIKGDNRVYMRTSYKPFGIPTFVIISDSNEISHIGEIVSISEDQEVIPIAGSVIVTSPEPQLTFGDLTVTDTFKVMDDDSLFMKIETDMYNGYNALNISTGRLHSWHVKDKVTKYNK